MKLKKISKLLLITCMTAILSSCSYEDIASVNTDNSESAKEFNIVDKFVELKSVNTERGNMESPIERVYDYADVLSDDEEEQLRKYIAKREPEIQADIVLVIINEDVEAEGMSWETAMMNCADDFYDEHKYGYDSVHGNGILLLDNYYEGQEGWWLSTCGSVMEKLGDDEIDEVLNAIEDSFDEGAVVSYKEYVDTACRLMKEE